MERAFIPNSAPWITEREITAVTATLKSGRIASNPANLGPVKDALRQFTNGKEALLTTSCTTAMELALRCLDIREGDEVILPSYTFTSTANAIVQCGGTPVFVDIDADTLNLDLDDVAAKRTAKTRTIMPVHYAGISCDMDRLLAFADTHHLSVVEDAAHALGAKYKGRFLGALGTFGCFSFHDTKNYVAGEGGALVIGDPHFQERAERMYEKGTNRAAFLKGEVDKYTWVSSGSSYTMSGLLAVLLLQQLDRFESILLARAAIVARYREGLARLVEEGHIRFGSIPDYATPIEHIAFFLVRDATRRDDLLRYLKAQGIGALFHYVPLHLSPYARERWKTYPGQFPVTETCAASIVRLPLFPQLPAHDCDYIIDNVLRFFHPDHRLSAPPASAAAQESEEMRFDLSLVVPCYQESGHLHNSLNQIIEILDRTSLHYEIILIDDCSRDDTAALIRQYLTLHPRHNLRAVFHETNRGRGATVDEGIRMSRGRYVGFVDIDLEVPARYIPGALMPLLGGRADMVLADRSYKFQLHALSRFITTTGYRRFVRTLLGTPHLDTEAGFKFFRRDAVLPVLDRTKDARWFWDTEITVRCLDAGLRIHSEPVLFQRRREKKSTVKLFRDSWRSFVAIVRFRRLRNQERRMT